MHDKDRNDSILELSCAQLCESLDAGQRMTCRFQIHASQYIYGDIYSSDTRVANVQKHFEANTTVDVEINGTYLEPGEEIKGEFCMITNVGEFTLPFLICASTICLESSQGEIKNLFHFANLAQANWQEAVQLFYSPDFHTIFTKKDAEYLILYKGLSQSPGNEQNVEEFLIAISKKLPVDFQLDTDGIVFDDVFSSFDEEICIKKSGWGYTCLQVEKEGDFFSISQEEFTNEDFENHVARLQVHVDATRLKEGMNLGFIHVFNTKTSLKIPVRIMMNRTSKKVEHIEGIQEYLSTIVNCYVNAKLHIGSEKENVEKAKHAIEGWLELDEDAYIPCLYRVQLLLSLERFNEAQWYLDEIGKRLKKENVEPEIKCYYYYLSTLYNRDENYLRSVLDALETALGKHQDSWQIAMMISYLDDEQQTNPDAKWNYLEERFELGCSSPVLFAEAYQLLREHPTFLMKLGPFEQEVLWFAVKKNILTRELQEHFIYLAGRVQSYSDLLFSVSAAIFEYTHSDQLLTAICRFLILGCKTGERYFKWYELAIARSIRITGLYEYYMYSLDLTKKIPLPKILLMYFSYQSQLDAEHTAFLYRYILEYAPHELVAAYQEAMERFVVDQIKAGNMSEDLAFLYEQLIAPQMLRDEVAHYFTTLLFMHKIEVANPFITSVVLVQERMQGESTYPVENGCCMLPVFGVDYAIFLQDACGNRYVKSVPFTDRQMIDYENVLPDITKCLEGRPSFDFYLCEREHASIVISQDNCDRIRKLADSELLEQTVKRELRIKLLHFYYDEDEMSMLDAFLDDADDEEMDACERAEFMRFLITRGKFDKAYLWLKRYGASGVNQKNIARLVSKRIQSSEYMEDDFLINVSFHVFRKAKYDDATVQYLLKYYNGKIRDLRDIWRVSQNLDLPALELEERMLRQMLLTKELVGEKNDILLSYEAREHHNEQLVEQYFEQIARDFFVDAVLTEADVLERLYSRYLQMGASRIQKLALLLYWADNPDKRESVPKQVITDFLEELYKEQICFAFFKELSDYLPQLHYIQDKTFVEYKAKQNGKVKLHYLIDEIQELEPIEQEAQMIYHCEEMKQVMDGIYVKDFTLFQGELLQYYITEEIDGQETITFSDSIQGAYEGERTGERFGQLNDVIISMSVKDEVAEKKLLEEYLFKDYCVREIFRTI